MHRHIYTVSAIVLLILLVQLALAAPGPRNEQAIKDVADGKTSEAKASWWGFDPEDSTKALQAAVDSGAAKLTVENMGAPWVVETIRLASDQEIVFEEGVEVLARRGSFKGGGDCLFRADEKQNITLTGYGATMRMWQVDYDGPDYTKAEWRHVLSFKSCTNIKVYGLTLTESGGDGIYLGTARRGVTNKDIHIKDVVCDKNYRQGISVITAENLLIEDTVMSNTAGTAPQAGIDFEPNNPDERLVNCVMRNCVSEGNIGAGYVLYLPPMSAASEPVSVLFEDCEAIDNRSIGGGVITGNTPNGAVKGSIEFVRCVFEHCGQPGISVSNKPVNGCAVRFEDCTVIEPDARALAPILLGNRQDATETIGGVEFKNVLVVDSQDRNPMAYVNLAGGIGLGDITGNLVVQKGEEKQEYALTKELLAKWMPVIAIKNIPRVPLAGMTLKPLVESAPPATNAPKIVRVRRAAKFGLYAQKGDAVSFQISYMPVAKYSGNAMPVTVTAPSGEQACRAELPFKEQTTVKFTAKETGLHRLDLDPGANYAQIVSSSHPINLLTDGGWARLYGTQGELFFWVPEGTREFGVRASGEGAGEAVKFALIDPEGKVVDEYDNVTQLRQMEVQLDEGAAGGAWRLRLAKATKIMMEDYFVELRGVPPLLAGSRDALLVPAE